MEKNNQAQTEVHKHGTAYYHHRLRINQPHAKLLLNVLRYRTSYIPDVIGFASIFHTNTKLDKFRIFSQDWATMTGRLLSPLWECMRKVSYTLPSSGSESRVNNLAVANLRSYPLSRTAASWDITV